MHLFIIDSLVCCLFVYSLIYLCIYLLLIYYLLICLLLLLIWFCLFTYYLFIYFLFISSFKYLFIYLFIYLLCEELFGRSEILMYQSLQTRCNICREMDNTLVFCSNVFYFLEGKELNAYFPFIHFPVIPFLKFIGERPSTQFHLL